MEYTGVYINPRVVNTNKSNYTTQYYAKMSRLRLTDSEGSRVRLCSLSPEIVLCLIQLCLLLFERLFTSETVLL